MWLVQAGGMKVRNFWSGWEKQDAQLIATFGRARLVRHWDRGYELRGGSAADLADAREWISLFMHEAVVRPAPNA